MRKQTSEYKNLTNLMDRLLEVPHRELKAKLDEEKKAKVRKRKPKKSSASREVGERD